MCYEIVPKQPGGASVARATGQLVSVRMLPSEFSVCSLERICCFYDARSAAA